MGTRNLTCVYLDGKCKVAQYGQWDGYPEGQGVTCLNFLRDEMVEPKFREELRKRQFAPEGYIKGIYDAFGAKDGFISIERADKLNQAFPQFSRNTAAEILKMIMDDEIGDYLQNSLDFAADSLYCEWCYVIDLDKQTFEVYQGFNTEPLPETDRFYYMEGKSREASKWIGEKYHPVRFVRSWSFDELPTEEEFLGAFKEDGDE